VIAPSADSPRTGASDTTAIVGGGLLGLTLALRLARRGERVTLFEASPDLGGLASAWRIGEVTWDRHYHVTLFSDRRLRALLAELDLERELVWSQVGTGFFSDGRFHPMNSALDFLRFPPLGLIDKFRLGTTILRASRIADPLPLEDIPIETWLTKLSGRKTFAKIWRPLLRAKLGERYREASAAFIWAIVVRLYAARRAGLGSERFGYVPGGYARVLDTLRRKLDALGVEFVLGAPVESVAHDASGTFSVRTPNGTRAGYARAIVTAPARHAARICADLSEDERSGLLDKRYQGIVCASLLLDEPLGPYYVTNLTDEWVPFSAVIEMSALVDRAQFGGGALVYLPKYVAGDDPLFEVDDETLRAQFCTALERMYPHFKREQVRAFRVSRVRDVFPIATLGYSRGLPPIATSVPGLFVVNAAHIVNGTLNANETISLAERALAAISPGERASTAISPATALERA
jgi:protoporphyrinogen oxidase